MSFLSKLFKNNTNNENKMNKTTEKLSIKEIEFTSLSNEKKDEIYNKVIELKLNNKLSEAEEMKLQRMVRDSCEMNILSQNDIKLYRMAKSTDDIAKKSVEGWRNVEHKPNSVVHGNPNGRGLSLTTAENLIICIPYGDMVTEVIFDYDKLKQNNLLEEPVYKIDNMFEEYIAVNFLTGQMYSISNPNVLKMVIDMASDAAFEKALVINDESNISIKTALQKFEFFNTLTYWENIKDRYKELVSQNVENKIGILRLELCDILNKTPTVANDVFNNKENFNLTTDNQDKDREEL